MTASASSTSTGAAELRTSGIVIVVSGRLGPWRSRARRHGDRASPAQLPSPDLAQPAGRHRRLRATRRRDACGLPVPRRLRGGRDRGEPRTARRDAAGPKGRARPAARAGARRRRARAISTAGPAAEPRGRAAYRTRRPGATGPRRRTIAAARSRRFQADRRRRRNRGPRARSTAVAVDPAAPRSFGDSRRNGDAPNPRLAARAGRPEVGAGRAVCHPHVRSARRDRKARCCSAPTTAGSRDR